MVEDNNRIENTEGAESVPDAGSAYDVESETAMVSASKDERTWGMLCHLAGLAIIIIPPLGGIIGSLIVWLLKKDQSPFVDDQGREALNFQISVLVYILISSALIMTLILAVLGIPLLIAVVIFDFVMIIIASTRASNGELYRYPLSIRFFPQD